MQERVAQPENELRRGRRPHAPEETITLSLTAAAQMLGIHRTTAYDHARKGIFPVRVFRVGNLLKVNRAQLEAYIAGDESPRN